MIIYNFHAKKMFWGEFWSNLQSLKAITLIFESSSVSTSPYTFVGCVVEWVSLCQSQWTPKPSWFKWRSLSRPQKHLWNNRNKWINKRMFTHITQDLNSLELYAKHKVTQDMRQDTLLISESFFRLNSIFGSQYFGVLIMKRLFHIE